MKKEDKMDTIHTKKEICYRSSKDNKRRRRGCKKT
jgi:hypothetical protein